MGYRILDVKVAKVNLGANKLIIKIKKIGTKKVRYLKNVFLLHAGTLITSSENQTVQLSEIKVGNRVTIDFIKTQDKKLLAKGISILN
ncbi:MAG: hypothetical protein COV71_03685 [Candidatus Omnitrophica bacterium CG11_big_fil_rev_8_21_14_0_20_41_12]|nr:MAG: hypothetical protein COV71_03685 [Candidatus Omnitrophica bacterium CG11_big_fil_rev_8_21_14_0_20_41_12]